MKKPPCPLPHCLSQHVTQSQSSPASSALTNGCGPGKWGHISWADDNNDTELCVEMGGARCSVQVLGAAQPRCGPTLALLVAGCRCPPVLLHTTPPQHLCHHHHTATASNNTWQKWGDIIPFLLAGRYLDTYVDIHYNVWHGT